MYRWFTTYIHLQWLLPFSDVLVLDTYRSIPLFCVLVLLVLQDHIVLTNLHVIFNNFIPVQKNTFKVYNLIICGIWEIRKIANKITDITLKGFLVLLYDFLPPSLSPSHPFFTGNHWCIFCQKLLHIFQSFIWMESYSIHVHSFHLPSFTLHNHLEVMQVISVY